jgi:PhzF family phenazine biosynthesis protein
MQHRIFIVDAFADRPFTGNPAAVCLLDSASPVTWMQQVAAEMNLSETAFLKQNTAGGWDLRWFTPTTEVDLCGHATLASAHVLWHACERHDETLQFHTRSGVLTVTRSGEDLSMDFPSDPPQVISSNGPLNEALGVAPAWVGRGRHDVLAVLADEAQVRSLAPDMAKLARLETRGVIVTARSSDSRYNFVSRFFAPGAGIPEDPVTGSAHCTLGPYWGERLSKTTLCGFQVSARGGAVHLALHGDRIVLTGRAVTTLRGALYV